MISQERLDQLIDAELARRAARDLPQDPGLIAAIIGVPGERVRATLNRRKYGAVTRPEKGRSQKDKTSFKRRRPASRATKQWRANGQLP